MNLQAESLLVPKAVFWLTLAGVLVFVRHAYAC